VLGSGESRVAPLLVLVLLLLEPVLVMPSSWSGVREGAMEVGSSLGGMR
jgi:hypothetical protein